MLRLLLVIVVIVFIIAHTHCCRRYLFLLLLRVFFILILQTTDHERQERPRTDNEEDAGDAVQTELLRLPVPSLVDMIAFALLSPPSVTTRLRYVPQIWVRYALGNVYAAAMICRL